MLNAQQVLITSLLYSQKISQNSNIFEGNENEALDSTFITKKEYKLKVKKIINEINFDCYSDEIVSEIVADHLEKKLNLIRKNIGKKNDEFLIDLNVIAREENPEDKLILTNALLIKYNILSMQNEKFDFRDVSKSNIDAKITQINRFYSIIKKAYENVEILSHIFAEDVIIEKCMKNDY